MSVIGAIRLGQGQIAIGAGKMFPAQAAVVVGGTSLAGGEGGVTNTIVGVLIMTVLDNGLLVVNMVLTVLINPTKYNKDIAAEQELAGK